MHDRGEFWVVGAEPNPGGAPFALLPREKPEGLTYASSAFVTLDDASRDRFWTGIERLRIARPVVPQLRGGNRQAAWGQVGDESQGAPSERWRRYAPPWCADEATMTGVDPPNLNTGQPWADIDIDDLLGNLNAGEAPSNRQLPVPDYD